MAGNNVLRWRDGRGWLVLSGGAAIESEIRAMVLERASADGGVAYISVQPPDHSDALNDMDDLGAPTGYIVDVLAEDDETVRARLGDAGIIVIEDSNDVEVLRSGLFGAASTGMREAFERGAIILAEGCGASVLGSWVLLGTGELKDGLSWVEQALIMPAVESVSHSQQARQLLDSEPNSLVIGIEVGSALALGPAGEVELWGDRRVTIALGRGYGN